MLWEDEFYCTYCGKKFGNEPAKLAIHIKNYHEIGHRKSKKHYNFYLFVKLKKNLCLSSNKHFVSLII